MMSRFAHVLDLIIGPVVFFSGLYALYAILLLAPLERNMGAVQKVLYVHVGSAMAAYLCLATLFVSAVCFFTFGNRTWIHLLRSASQIAFWFASIVLLTGMIWGYSSWDTWWRWEPRLVSVLILWVFLISIVFASRQKFNTQREEGVMLSVLGILCAIQVPIVMFSIKLLDRTEQLHPEVIAQQGLTAYEYKLALIVTNIAVMLLAVWLMRVRFVAETVEDSAMDIERKLIMSSK